MSLHDDKARMGHMLDHARIAVRITSGRQRQNLETDEMLRLALIRAIEVIGEAADRVSKETCQAYPAIEWSRITGMRHRLIHGYDKIDLDILWDTVQIDLPPLIAQLEVALAQ